LNLLREKGENGWQVNHKKASRPFSKTTPSGFRHLLRADLVEAVFVAYGWKSNLSHEEVLEKLMALNLERSQSVSRIKVVAHICYT
jgi:hypothetical protein